MARVPRRDRARLRTSGLPRFDKRAVAAEGSTGACLYLVGEAPGRREAVTGRPFVGPAGQALRDMMRESGVDASQVRLANAIPFRPVERSQTGSDRNRRPTKQELEIYGRLVLADIASVRPRFIGALGRSAAALFGAPMPVKQARGRHFQFRGIPVRVTYHPAFVLRFGGRGSRLWRSTVLDLSRFWSEARKQSDRTGSKAPTKARLSADPRS
jgi:DNA polymerase